MATPTGRDLDALIEEATVDCYDEAEQVAGFFACLEEELELPFTTRLFGVDVSVEQIEQTDNDDIVAVCRRDTDTAAIRLVDLPLPTPLPEGAQWIAAWKKCKIGSCRSLPHPMRGSGIRSRGLLRKVCEFDS